MKLGYVMTPLLLAGALVTFSALAQNHPIAGASKEATATDAANTMSYWTLERLANAKPMELLEADRSEATEAAPASKGPQVFVKGGLPEVNLAPALGGPKIAPSTPGQPEAEDLAFSYVYPYSTYYNTDWGSYPSKTIGRLFFTLEGVDYSCSASVIRPFTLVTARHCTFDYATGKFGSNWIFYPDLNDGKADTAIGGGKWLGAIAYTFVANAPNFEYDIAFIALHDQDGRGCGGNSGTHPINYYTGYLGYTYNGSFSQRQWAVFGYPAETGSDGNPFNGNWQIRSDAATGNINTASGFTDTVEVGSDQTGGASGGPWIIGYNPGSGSTATFSSNNVFSGHGDGNFVNSVNSFKFTSPSHPLAINGPEFLTANFVNLLSDYNSYAASHGCP